MVSLTTPWTPEGRRKKRIAGRSISANYRAWRGSGSGQRGNTRDCANYPKGMKLKSLSRGKWNSKKLGIERERSSARVQANEAPLFGNFQHQSPAVRPRKSPEISWNFHRSFDRPLFLIVHQNFIHTDLPPRRSWGSKMVGDAGQLTGRVVWFDQRLVSVPSGWIIEC